MSETPPWSKMHWSDYAVLFLGQMCNHNQSTRLLNLSHWCGVNINLLYVALFSWHSCLLVNLCRFMYQWIHCWMIKRLKYQIVLGQFFAINTTLPINHCVSQNLYKPVIRVVAVPVWRPVAISQTSFLWAEFGEINPHICPFSTLGKRLSPFRGSAFPTTRK